MNLKYSCYAFKRSACYTFELWPETTELNDETWAEGVNGCCENLNDSLWPNVSLQTDILAVWTVHPCATMKHWGSELNSWEEKWSRKKVEWRLMTDKFENRDNATLDTSRRSFSLPYGLKLGNISWFRLWGHGCLLFTVASSVVLFPCSLWPFVNARHGEQNRTPGSSRAELKGVSQIITNLSLMSCTDRHHRITEAETIELRDLWVAGMM